jgi:hypothetical protein
MAECSGNEKMKKNCENHEKCMEMIQAVLDGSASPDEILHFKSNIEVCMPCIEGYELQKSIKQSLATKVEKKCCPQATIDKLKTKIGIALLLFFTVSTQIRLIKFYLFS